MLFPVYGHCFYQRTEQQLWVQLMLMSTNQEDRQCYQILYFQFFSRNPPKPIPKCPKTLPRHIPTWPKNFEKVTPTWPKSDQKVTCTSQESNTVPWGPESEDQPTRLFRHQKMSSLRNVYASKIQNWCPHPRRGFFRAQNSDFLFFWTHKRAIFVVSARK